MKLSTAIKTFMKEEDGAQVVEYALIIAMVSIALALALQTAFTGDLFTTFVARVRGCLTGDAAACAGG